MIKGRLHDLLDSSGQTFRKPEIAEINPRRFNDPIAMECGWDPLDHSNRNFETHVLTTNDRNHLLYRPNTTIRLAGLILLIVGAALSVTYMTRIFDSMATLFFGSAFLLAGIYMTVKNLKPFGFDGNRREFHRGYSFQKDTHRVKGSKILPFDNIHAVQLLTKALKIGTEFYMTEEYLPSYEVNLVNKDASRVYVMTYMDRETASRDAEQIAQMIEVPLWTALPQ